MAKFFGKNDLQKVSNLASERVKYYLDAYSKDPLDGLDQQPITNFNLGENTLYGRVDQSLNTVHPKPEFIVPLNRASNQEAAPRVLDFVADMFLDLSNNFEKACRLQIYSNNDPYLSTIKAYQFHQDAEISYRNYIKTLMRDYYKNYIIAGKRQKEIMSLNDFIHGLQDYIKLQGEYYPATFTGYLSSNQSSIFNTGLAIAITPLDKGDDTAKEEFFLRNPAFDYYLNLCKNIGFSVSKNSPWVLVADLASPAIKPYINRYNMFTVKDIFNNRFNQSYLSDYDKIVNSIITYYREFVNLKPYEKYITSCNNTTKTEIKYRETINNNTINYINNNIIYEIYCNIRNIEERNILQTTDLNRVTRDAIRYQKVLPREDIYAFINETFVKQRPNQEGSFTTIKNNKKDLTKEPENVTNISKLFSGGY